jgi:hypothetical protein
MSSPDVVNVRLNASWKNGSIAGKTILTPIESSHPPATPSRIQPRPPARSSLTIVSTLSIPRRKWDQMGTLIRGGGEVSVDEREIGGEARGIP